MWELRTTARYANLHGERVIQVLRMELYQLLLASPGLTLSQICSLLLKVLPTKGLVPATHTRKSTPPQLSRACRKGGDMGGREVWLQWDTILVGLVIRLDPVLERNNPKQGWRMAGSLFRSQQQTSEQSWGFSSDGFCAATPGTPTCQFLNTSFLEYTSQLSIFLSALDLAKNQDLFFYNISVPAWILPKGLVFQEGRVDAASFPPKGLPTSSSPSCPERVFSLLRSVQGRLWDCQAELSDMVVSQVLQWSL